MSLQAHYSDTRSEVELKGGTSISWIFDHVSSSTAPSGAWNDGADEKRQAHCWVLRERAKACNSGAGSEDPVLSVGPLRLDELFP